MATCRICGNEVAEDAIGCVVCGIKNPIAKPQKPGGLKRALWWTFAGVFLLPIAGLLALFILAGIASLFSDDDRPEAGTPTARTSTEHPQHTQAPTPKPRQSSPAPMPKWIPKGFVVVETKDISSGNRLRRRLTIMAPSAKTREERIATLMQAAQRAWRKHHSQFITVFMIAFKDGPQIARIDFAPDGCGVSGTGSDCTGREWTDANASEVTFTAEQESLYSAWEESKDKFKETDPEHGFEFVNEGRLKVFLSDRLGMSSEQVGQVMVDMITASIGGMKEVTVPASVARRFMVSEAERKKAEDVVCRHNLQCWGNKHHVNATVTCQYIIEGMARYAHEWTDTWLESKFPRFVWDDKEAGTLKYGGNKVRFQKGFGAWQNMSYWCTYDPSTERAAAEVFN